MNKVLRAAMADTGQTVESLAEQVGVDPKTVARWITPGRVPHPRHRAAAASALGCEVEDVWPDVFKRREPAWLRPWVETELQATSLRAFQVAVIPGLLQTPEYASVVLSSGLLGPEEVGDYVETRMRRQSAVLDRRKPPLFVAVIDEFALRRGEPDVMHPQIDHLVKMAQRPNILLHVLPLDAGIHGGQAGPFVIATTEDGDVAYLDDQAAGRLTEDTAALWAIWDTLRSVALPRRQTIDFLEARSWLT
ncbi:helix-turn-helix transcriptional regulator [Micromonospora peucetia]|uniref:Helix-turn-helix transcriptional regulator n=1 Tax=Micromonospora peucetia TaxID=47871 RepID=A0ABZ1EML4_9ACTN|nr:helix-turn-helix transcriptional regulator [Micromonospora peucetia]MCX4389252.1 helix-turn-helix transcriptional regulator [Micromonospora peucetia]WSA35439.1 helix-turn-helix transcriptional regulator [Micromonospora peucetia]